MSWSHVGAFAGWNERDPRLVFRDWAQEFVAHFDREHPPTASTRAAELLRADPLKTWTMPDLARAAGTRPVRLRHEFHARFGMRTTDYLHLVRAARAVSLFRTGTKVEAIAWEVGYRSKKDLYEALRRWVGATPSELRALSDDERRWLEAQLEAQLRLRVGPGVNDATAGADATRAPGGLIDACGGRASGDTPAFHRPGPRPRRVPLPHT